MRSFVIALLIVLVASVAFGQLPQIAAVEAEVKPAVEQVTYDSWFLRTLVMRADNEVCRMRLIFVRYSYAEKKMSDDPADELTVEVGNAYDEAAKYTVWQQSLGAIVAAASKVAQQHELLNRISEVDQQIESAAEGVDTTALGTQKASLESSLSTVIESMGPIAQE